MLFCGQLRFGKSSDLPTVKTAVVHGLAHGDRDCRLGGKGERLSSRPRPNDGRRPCHPRTREGNPISGSGEKLAKKKSYAELTCDAHWKLRVFTLEVTSNGGTRRDSDDYVHKRSAEKRSSC